MLKSICFLFSVAFSFSKLMQRIHKHGYMRNTTLTPDKKPNIMECFPQSSCTRVTNYAELLSAFWSTPCIKFKCKHILNTKQLTCPTIIDKESETFCTSVTFCVKCRAVHREREFGILVFSRGNHAGMGMHYSVIRER